MMEITRQTVGKICIIGILGRIDSSTSENVEKVLNNVIDQDQAKVIVDLAGVDYISAAGLRVMLAALKKQRQRQGELKLAALQPFVKEVFEVTGFNKLFSIHTNREEAEKSLPP